MNIDLIFYAIIAIAGAFTARYKYKKIKIIKENRKINEEA